MVLEARLIFAAERWNVSNIYILRLRVRKSGRACVSSWGYLEMTVQLSGTLVLKPVAHEGAESGNAQNSPST